MTGRAWKMTRSILITLVALWGSMAIAAEKITVFAAASLTNAMQEIAENYKKQHDVDIVYSFASSSTLARQIEQGAPADLFLSADQQWMDYISGKEGIEKDSRVTLLGNELVLIAPSSAADKKIDINKETDWSSLLGDGRLAVGDPDHVPAGIYTKEALQSLGSWELLEKKMARANNVRAAMALVEREEAPLGVVYGSDAVASSKVAVVGVFPKDSHKPVEYPMAIVDGHKKPEVTAYYDYLKGADAAVVFKKFGFTPL